MTILKNALIGASRVVDEMHLLHGIVWVALLSHSPFSSQRELFLVCYISGTIRARATKVLKHVSYYCG